MFINVIRRGDRVVFVDDVISTGGTLLAIVKALRTIGAEIVDILIVFEKTREKVCMEKELGVRIQTLLKVDVVQGKLVERPRADPPPQRTRPPRDPDPRSRENPGRAAR